MIFAHGEIVEMNSTGILFQQLGKAYTFGENWRIISLGHLQNYTQEAVRIEQYLKYLKDLKININNVTLISDLTLLINEFQILLESINDINEIIIEKEHPKRKTRAILPLIGKGIQLIFGNPDEDTANEIFQKLEDLRKTDQEIIISLQNQTIITEKIVETTKESLTNLSHEINTVMEEVKYLAQQEYEQERLNQMFMYTQTITLSVIRYTKYQKQLLHALIADNTNLLDPELIPYSELKGILNKLEEKIESHTMFPHQILEKNRKLALYKFIYMQAYIHENYLIYEFKIPTVSRDSKVIYAVNSAPTVSENSLKYIEPKSPFILVNQKFTEISFLTQEIDKECIMLQKQIYLCSNEIPIYTKFSGQCELELLDLEDYEKETCIIKELPLTSLILKLYYPNQYYFVTPEPMSVKLNCQGNISNIILNKTGVIDLEPFCTLYNREVSLQAIGSKEFAHINNYKNIQTKLEKIKPRKELPTLSVTNNLSKMIRNYDEILQTLNENKKKQKAMLQKSEESTGISNKTIGMISAILIIITLIIIYKLIKMFK